MRTLWKAVPPLCITLFETLWTKQPDAGCATRSDAEDGDEEQLNGVVRMLSEKDLQKRPFPLFSKALADQGPNT